MNYAVIEKTTKVVINNIEWDGQSFLDQSIIDNYDLVPWDETTKGYPVSPGYTYDDDKKVFIIPKPEDYPSWVFDHETAFWQPPIPEPNDGKIYIWNESIVNWESELDLKTTQENSLTPDQQLQNIISGITT
jgi:hypothetical protein